MKACPQCGRLLANACWHDGDSVNAEELVVAEIIELLWVSIEEARSNLDALYDDLEAVVNTEAKNKGHVR